MMKTYLTKTRWTIFHLLGAGSAHPAPLTRDAVVDALGMSTHNAVVALDGMVSHKLFVCVSGEYRLTRKGGDVLAQVRAGKSVNEITFDVEETARGIA